MKPGYADAVRIVFLPLAVASAIALAAAPTHAYLALIRQGQESADLAQAGDQFGTTLAAGDFNGDGYEDLASAAPEEDRGLGPPSEHGTGVISTGAARGIPHVDARLLTVGAVPDASVRYGQALAVGDFNHDGYDDLAGGLPLMEPMALTIAKRGGGGSQ